MPTVSNVYICVRFIVIYSRPLYLQMPQRADELALISLVQVLCGEVFASHREE